MSSKEFYEKIVVTITGAWISNKLKLLFPMLFLLIVLMIIDYASGMVASKKEAIEHPNSKKYGWSSKKSILGIYKKVGYILTIFVAIVADYIIYKLTEEIGVRFGAETFFGFLVTIWFIINEIISILENAGRMGVILPKFLNTTLTELKNDIDDSEIKK